MRLAATLLALLGKEIRQHLGVWISLIVLQAMGFLVVLLGAAVNDDTVSLLEAYTTFLLVFLTVAALVMGNRLVVAEYYARTQLFVEALPLRRWEMIAIKYLLGLILLFLLAGLSLALSAFAASFREAITAPFVLILAARGAAYLFCVWSFFFTMGLVGRFRVPVYLAIVLGASLLDESTTLEIDHFGPLAVVHPATLPYERELPVRAMAETLAVGGAWLGLAFLLALIHEGSVAEVLARRMSQKEKALVGILFVAYIIALGVFDERRSKEPLAFPETAVLASDREPIEILYLRPDLLPAARSLLRRLEEDLGGLGQALGWSSLPHVRVAYRGSLDGGVYDRALLSSNEGVLVRANFMPTSEWDETHFRAYLVAQVLDEYTRDRAQFEPKAWLRDGFAHWWSRRRDPDPALSCDPPSQSLLRALWVSRNRDLEVKDLASWLRYRERHGEEMAAALAFSGLAVLESFHGSAVVLELARRVFGRRPAEDVRETLYEWRHPMAVVFQQSTSVAWPSFVAAWAAELERLRGLQGCRRVLATVLDGQGEIEIEPGEGAVRDVVYRFRFSRPPPPDTLLTLLHLRLSPFDFELKPHRLRRREHLWRPSEAEASFRISGSYGQGSRVFLALEVESPVLGCGLRLLSQRQEIL